MKNLGKVDFSEELLFGGHFSKTLKQVAKKVKSEEALNKTLRSSVMPRASVPVFTPYPIPSSFPSRGVGRGHRSFDRGVKRKSTFQEPASTRGRFSSGYRPRSNRSRGRGRARGRGRGHSQSRF